MHGKLLLANQKFLRRRTMRRIVMSLIAIALSLAACSQAKPAVQPTPTPSPELVKTPTEVKLEGSIAIDGSSTVYLITEAMAEEFGKKYPGVRITVGISGTGGGFKKFCNGETDINDASRPIKSSEIEQCQKNGIDYIELPIGYDGIAVVVNPQNDWVDYMTVEELKKLWEPEAQGKITRWNQIRPNWPDKPINLYGPGVDSGTFEYFTEAIVGKAGSARGDFLASEDDNVLVHGVANDIGGLGYFGLAYYEENTDKLKVVPIDSGTGPVTPTMETVRNGTYRPLSRPLFIYVKKTAAERPEVKAFVRFYLDPKNAMTIIKEVGYIPLPEEVYKLALERFEKGLTGSVFGGKGAQPGITLEELLKREK